MDIDRPLDDLIPKRANKAKAPRVSTGGAERSDRRKSRGSDAPYSRPPPRSTEEKWVHDAYEGGGKRPSFGAGKEATAGSQYVSASPRLEVSGIHYEVTPDELKSVFEQAGTIVQGPAIRYDRAGRSTGVCTVEYASAAQAKSALNQFDGAMMKGQTITIKLIAPPRPREKQAKKPNATSGDSLLARLGGERGERKPQRDRPERSDRPPRRGGWVPTVVQGTDGRSTRGGHRDKPASGGRGKRGPASAADLDAELAGFMKTDDVAM